MVRETRYFWKRSKKKVFFLSPIIRASKKYIFFYKTNTIKKKKYRLSTMKKSYKTIKNMFMKPQKVLSYIIKVDILIVHVFCKTPIFVLYLFIIILGVFGGKGSNIVNNVLLLITFYISGLGITICFVCHVKTFYNWALSLLGNRFLEKYVPKKGVTNACILYLPLVIFVGIEILSLKYQISQNIKECNTVFETGQSLLRSGYPEKAKIMFNKLPDMYKSNTWTEGYMTLLANHPFMLKARDVLSQIFGL